MRNVWDNPFPNCYNKLMKCVGQWARHRFQDRILLARIVDRPAFALVGTKTDKVLKANAMGSEFISDPMKKIVSSTAPAIQDTV